MRHLMLIVSGIAATFGGIGSVFGKVDSENPSDSVDSAIQRWISAERDVCASLIKLSDLEEMSAQEIYDFRLLSELISQVSDSPIEYCDSLLMENMTFTKPPKKRR